MLTETDRWSVTLPSAATSVPAARHFLRHALGGRLAGETVDTAELCLSELVTNAVLHAGTRLDVGLRVDADELLMTVKDASDALPQRRPHRREAATGRGLGLVAAFARAWGVEDVPDGKCVWCRLSLAPSEPDDEMALAAWGADVAGLNVATPPPTDERLVDVVLLGVPVRRAVRAREHWEALRRECQLLALDPAGAEGERPRRLLAMAESATVGHGADADGPGRALLAALAGGRGAVDLRYRLDPEDVDRIPAWRAALAAADHFCREGGLLTLATPRDQLELRAWVLAEVERQSGGAAPQPWSGPLD